MQLLSETGIIGFILFFTMVISLSIRLLKESFIKNGGEKFDLIPCLNDNSNHISLFEHVVKKYL